MSFDDRPERKQFIKLDQTPNIQRMKYWHEPISEMQTGQDSTQKQFSPMLKTVQEYDRYIRELHKQILDWANLLKEFNDTSDEAILKQVLKKMQDTTSQKIVTQTFEHQSPQSFKSGSSAIQSDSYSSFQMPNKNKEQAKLALIIQENEEIKKDNAKYIKELQEQKALNQIDIQQLQDKQSQLEEAKRLILQLQKETGQQERQILSQTSQKDEQLDANTLALNQLHVQLKKQHQQIISLQEQLVQQGAQHNHKIKEFEDLYQNKIEGELKDNQTQIESLNKSVNNLQQKIEQITDQFENKNENATTLENMKASSLHILQTINTFNNNVQLLFTTGIHQEHDDQKDLSFKQIQQNSVLKITKDFQNK